MSSSRPNVPRRWPGVFAAVLICSACSFTVSLDHLQSSGGAGGAAGADASGGAGGAGGTSGSLMCPAGTEDCDADGTTCEELATDATNCGLCGRDCLGGACVEGACEPIVLWVGGEMDGRATGIDQSDDNVFACTTLGLVRVPKVGGAPLMLTTDPVQPRIDVDGAHAFFTAGSLRRVPLSGGNVEILAQGTSKSGRGVRVDATHAYYVRYNTTDSDLVELVRVPRDGGTEDVVVMDGTAAWGVQLDDTNAYVMAASGLYRISKSTFSSAERIWAGDAGHSMAIVNGFGYVLGAGLWRIDLATGDATLLEPELSSGAVATDGERVYYTLYEAGEVGRVELDGTGRVAMANASPGVDVLVVDEDAIYFTQHLEQSVLKLAK